MVAHCLFFMQTEEDWFSFSCDIPLLLAAVTAGGLREKREVDLVWLAEFSYLEKELQSAKMLSSPFQ